MSGLFHGSTFMSKKNVYYQYTYVHYASHSLNLAVSDACNITSIWTCLGNIEPIYNFSTHQKHKIFTTSIQNVVPI